MSFCSLSNNSLLIRSWPSELRSLSRRAFSISSVCVSGWLTITIKRLDHRCHEVWNQRLGTAKAKRFLCKVFLISLLIQSGGDPTVKILDRLPIVKFWIDLGTIVQSQSDVGTPVRLRFFSSPSCFRIAAVSWVFTELMFNALTDSCEIWIPIDTCSLFL